MLHVYRAKHFKSLADQYFDVLSSMPRALFTKTSLVVVNNAVGQWLQQQQATREGISVNLELLTPDRFRWNLIKDAIPALESTHFFERDVLQFSILALLSDPEFYQKFKRLNDYLTNVTDADRMILAGKFSDAFVRYQVYRPEWLSAWENNEPCELGVDEAWQMAMWQTLLGQSDSLYRSRLDDTLVEKLTSGAVTLPGAICFFGITHLPQTLLKFLPALSQQTNVHVFAFDASSDRNASPEIAHWHNTGLFTYQQLDHMKPTVHGSQKNETAVDTALNALQAALTAQQPRYKDNAKDRSLLSVRCFSEMREIEALHDFLLDRFNNDSTLQPKDILVAIPNLETYAPFIRAVFGGSTPKIDYVISDSLAASDSPLINGLLSLLTLPEWRFTREEVMVFLRNRLVQKKFELGEADIDQIEAWLDTAGVKWGIDGAHKAELGVPADDGNTWRSGLHQLLLGAALPRDLATDLPLFNAVLPIDDLENTSALMFSRFMGFCDALFTWRDHLKSAHSIDVWQETLNGLLNDFFAEDDREAKTRETLRTVFEQSKTHADIAQLDTALSYKAMVALLADRTTASKGSAHITGAVKFTSMQTLAGLPFKQVCIVGMNYDSWPSQQSEPGFDLITKHPKPGDINSGEEKRYLTMQLILSAQDHLYMSYQGRNIHNNNDIPPSVILAELTDLCRSHGFKLPEVDHAMHSFSESNFQTADSKELPQSSAIQSHSAQWLSVAKRVGRGDRVAEALFELSAASVPLPEVIEFSQLLKFFSNPQVSFLKSALGVYIKDDSSEWDNFEPFDLANFADSRLREQVLAEHQRTSINANDEGETETVISAAATQAAQTMARASSILPLGVMGDVYFSNEAKQVASLLELAAAKHLPTDLSLTSLRVDLRVPIDVELLQALDVAADGGDKKLSLVGVIHGHFYEEGQLVMLPNKANYHTLMTLWLNHVALCATQHEGVGKRTTVLALDAAFCFKAMSKEQAMAALSTWITAYSVGQVMPIPFIPKCSFAYANSDKDDDKRLQLALTAWLPAEYAGGFPGVSEKPAVQYLYRGTNPIEGESTFGLISDSLLRELFQYKEELE
jgi:exodeoxyribonuclease V gamma subunit